MKPRACGGASERLMSEERRGRVRWAGATRHRGGLVRVSKRGCRQR
jgi:hypothetical protein